MLTNAHRSLLVVLALLVLAAPASAAEVARIDGAHLDARDDRGSGLCMELRTGDGFSGGGSSTCGRAPVRAHRSTLIAWVADDKLLTAGAVPASVTRAEAELVDGRRVAFDTVAGPGYRGRYAGKLRFFLAELPLADPSDDETGGLLVVRFYGADGTLQGAGAGDRLGAPIGRRKVVLRERGGRRSITVRAGVVRRHAPTPTALDRFEDMSCLFVSSRESRSQSSGSSMCREPGPNRPALQVFPDPGCGPVRTVLSGFVGDAVSAVRLRLGSGRVRDVPVRTLRGAQGEPQRYVAAAVPRGEAIRSISAVGAEEGYELGEPPGGLPCVPQGGAFAVSYYSNLFDGTPRPPGPDEQVAAEAGGHRLLVRDAEAERLCAGVDRLQADGSDCALPAVNGENAFGMASAGMISAVLPAEVARVRLPGGREVETVAGGYSGRYAGHVRFLLAEGKVGITDRVVLLDAAGGVIGRLPVFDPDADSEEPVAGPVRLAAGRGWRLEAARYAYGSCVSLRLKGDHGSCLFDVPEADGALAAVGCSPRIAVIAGVLERGSPAVRAVLRGGRTVRARTVRVPRRFGGGRAWVLTIPRGARVEALRFDARRFTFPLLPAADQCGYRVYAPGLAAPAIEVRSP